MSRLDRVVAGGHHGQHPWRPTERPPTTVACTDPHRGPHNRCSHPSPPPPGYHRCAGENGCPILIANRHPARLCQNHADDAVAADLRPYRDLLETA